MGVASFLGTKQDPWASKRDAAHEVPVPVAVPAKDLAEQVRGIPVGDMEVADCAEAQEGSGVVHDLRTHPAQQEVCAESRISPMASSRE